jgi:hypothetical protein
MKRYKFLDNMIFPALKRYSLSNFLAMKRYNRFRTYFFEAMQRYNIGNSRKCIDYYSDSKNWLFSRPAPPPAPPPPPGPLDWAWLSSIHTVTNYKSCTCSLSFTQAPGRKHRSLPISWLPFTILTLPHSLCNLISLQLLKNYHS